MAGLIELSDLPAALAGRSDAQSLIDTVSAMAETFCRRPLSLGTETEYHDGGDWHEIFLRRTPVVSVTEITVNGFAVTDYILSAETGRVRRGTGETNAAFAPWFPSGADNIRVIYAGGHSPIPADIKTACVNGVTNMTRDMARDPGLQSESFAGAYSWTKATKGPGVSAYASVFGDWGLAILRKYRRPGRYVVG